VYSEKDQELINKLLTGHSKSVNKALTEIYHDNFRQVRKFVLGNSGTEEDVKDIFQEGIVFLYFNVLSKKFKEQSTIATYLFAICKNLWLQRIRKRTASEILTADFTMVSEETSVVNSSILEELLSELKADCKQLLTGFYFEKKSMKELMIEYSLGSEQAAKNKKLRCMAFLMRQIKEKGLGIESFYL
jgi:RNA polymerase sigma factor (sigma-70 family)